MLRSNNLSVDIDPSLASLKSQFKKADRENAKVAIVIGEDEIANKSYTVKHMGTGEQKNVNEEKVLEYLDSILNF